MSSARNGTAYPAVPSPAAARRRLGSDLREMRKKASLTLAEVAEVIERSTATMSRLERGSLTPRVVDVRALLELYGGRVDGLVTDVDQETMLDLVRQSRKDEWFNAYSDVTGSNISSAELQNYVELESDAREALWYEMDLVPGLLQTPAYAAATAELFVAGDSSRKKRFVEFRMERKRALERLSLHVVINEVALRRRLGTAETMIEQLDTLAQHARAGRGSITIQIAPLALVLPAAVKGPFVLMRIDGQNSDVVYLERGEGAQYVRGAEKITGYADAFAELAAHALDREGSLKLIEEVTQSYR